ncbi:uncharacterized protein LOC115570283 [Scomber scombrus]|uniref:Uncharacterized protein LOC115570283 n=1 Tax=Scomber scombrus TaxID=13677 RepID=A0AAV1Q237_SCOSC
MLHVFYLLLTQVANHKTAQSYGPASVTLSEELYQHLLDYMDQSKCLPGREKGPATAFFNRLGGTYERMGDNFTREWRRFGLPGSPTLSDIRTAISTAVEHNLDQKERMDVHRSMCHDTATATRFYAIREELSEEKSLEVTKNILRSLKASKDRAGEPFQCVCVL